ncbi:Uncharacterised protein [Capnocytophaga ochracea]|jgi:hypothetical protein|uniref:Uncharacterized protein n=1 Tax=Capnocytophaga ochracea TaxID=1018 RepID=A0A7Z8YBB2_CAPOC|nr:MULTISPECIES: hypothetical protein [Capnocytophaga]QLF49568.1 hypothetical protein HW278_02000 [Capnocytophaga sp. oral taxon 902]UZD35983.1 hypothetical protein OLG90_09850 [Capnocytophaga ochracea]UZD40661.1 hypothetical protein OL231_10895 [Capnocytophaga ochracea]VDG81149.1 Uncharacterised protein [Capnocytophaga ochracea]
MKNQKKIEWFKKNIATYLSGYDITYRLYEEGDFGALNQVVLESSTKGGVIDFWEKEWLGVLLVDYKTEDVILNILLDSNEKDKQNEVLASLLKLL